MERLYHAFVNSSRAFSTLIRAEKAFQQEIGLIVVGVPVAWFATGSWGAFALLVGSLLLLLLVEVLNTGIEAACDAVSREFNIDIQLAKDCGSLAVLISIFIALGTWITVLFL
ncbi:MAG: diacylglycerol kinase [Rhizobiaceae bacterium]